MKIKLPKLFLKKKHTIDKSMNIWLKEKYKPNQVYWIIISIAVVLGIIIRLRGLSKWTLALDEYYLVKSAENILKYGLPQFPGGGYYTRGVLLQYMIAPLLALGVKAELASRIFTVIANLITIPPIYLIAKKVGNQLIATVVVIIFCFSIWEIEFARFARMYTPFQAIFMWYIYFAFDDLTNKSFKHFKWLISLSILSFLVYEGSIFLAVFNFVPFILNRKIDIKKFTAATFAFFASAFFNLFDFRTFNSSPILPPKYKDAIEAIQFAYPIKIPKILLPFSFDSELTILTSILLLVLNVFIIIKIIKLVKKKNFWSITSIIILGLLAFLNQFGLFIVLFILFVFWNVLNIDTSKKNIIFLFVFLLFVNLLYWTTFGLLTHNWYSLFNDFSSYSTWGVSKRLLVGFLNYPDNYYSLYNYFITLPLLTIGSALFSIALIITLFVNDRKNTLIKYLFGVLIFCVLLATIPSLLYEETRYTFFAVPLLLILVVYSIYNFSAQIFKQKVFQKFIFILCVSLLFVLSTDFNFYHITHIDKEDVNYRMIYKNKYIKKHLYRRWDVLDPVNFIKKNLHKNDKIMINENSLEYYLPKVDYFNFDYLHEAFVAISTNYGKKERWSNADLIYSSEMLDSLIQNRKSTVWFAVFPENYLYKMHFYEKNKKFLAYQGIDGLVKVYKFPKPTPTNHISK